MIGAMVEHMPQFLLLGLVGAAALIGYKQMKRDASDVTQRNRRTEAELKTGAQGTLVRGKDGVYRIQKD